MTLTTLRGKAMKENRQHHLPFTYRKETHLLGFLIVLLMVTICMTESATTPTNPTIIKSTSRSNRTLPRRRAELDVSATTRTRNLQQTQEVIRVHYGYFPEARPIHSACARGWLDLRLGNTLYQVSCYPQTSGNFAASRLDNGQLHIANLGSTPLAQAIARGIDLQVVYISHYMGNSQGIYVRGEERGYKPITNPFELVNRTIAVPFGSTMHYQVLFLLELFGLQGLVNVVNMAPSQIIQAWNQSHIDAAACWGVARDFVLRESEANGNPNLPPATTLMSAGVLANWGRPTYVVVAANRQFASQHPDFLRHFVAVISRINDSFVDRLGEIDTKNIDRWTAENGASLVPSMADVLMNTDEEFQNPSQSYVTLQRRALDMFEQLTWDQQVSCSYLPSEDLRSSSSNCLQPGFQHLAAYQTAQFLEDQKLISNLGIMTKFLENFDDNCLSDPFCGSDILDGTVLEWSQQDCNNCLYYVGPYGDGVNEFATSATLISELERLDIESGRSRYASSEIGRRSNNPVYPNGHSTCSGRRNLEVQVDDGMIEFGDGANAENGKTYSPDLNCSWLIVSKDCQLTDDPCTDILALNLHALRIWSGDVLKIFTDPASSICNTNRSDLKLLGQFGGANSVSFASGQQETVLRAKGCILVEFVTDANEERSYGDVENIGNGFKAIVTSTSQERMIDSMDNEPLLAEKYCNGFPLTVEEGATVQYGICMCDGFHWGGDCSVTDHCFGTNRLQLQVADRGPQFFASGGEQLVTPENLAGMRDQHSIDPSVAYLNDMNCVFELQVPDAFKQSEGFETVVELTIFYDVELGHDYIWLESGTTGGEVYYVLTGKHEDTEAGAIYYLPVDTNTNIARVRFTTDSRGRRGGFFAAARAINIQTADAGCDVPGYTGSSCEIPYCQPMNLPKIEPFEGIDDSYLLGRIISQAKGRSVRPMPWAPHGGCEWILGDNDLMLKKNGLAAVRLTKLADGDAEYFDLEAYPQSAVGDKVVLKTDKGTEIEFFVEECDSDEVCSHPWQVSSST